jgi:hypothetical protein
MTTVISSSNPVIGLWRFRGSNSPRPSVDALFDRNLSRGVEIDPGTAGCRWLGERLDYDLAIGHLVGVRNKLREAGSVGANARWFA